MNPVFSALGNIPGASERIRASLSSIESQNSTSSKRHIIARPFLDFHTQRQLYEEWVEIYNTHMRYIREARQKRGLQPKYQLIKSSQLVFIHELTRCIIEQLIEENRLMQSEGGLNLNPTAPYTLWINNVKLANRLNHQSDRTIRNHIKRLQSIGFIVAKRNHGTRADYELDINPEFLLFFDQSNPNVRPVSNLGGHTKEWELPERLRKNEPPYQNIDRTLNNLLKQSGASALNSKGSMSQKEKSSSSAKSIDSFRKNTPSEEKSIQQRLEAMCPHPALRQTGPFEAYQTKGARRHPLEPQIRPLVQQFLWMAHNKLWENSNVHPAEYQRTFEYIVERYFVRCRNLKEVRALLTKMEQIIDYQWKFVSQKKSRFTMYPSQFFDLDRTLRENDYSGFKGLWQFAIEKANRKRISEKQKKQWRAKRMYRKTVAEFSLKPTDGAFIALHKKVQRLWPEYTYELHRTYQSIRKANQQAKSIDELQEDPRYT